MRNTINQLLIIQILLFAFQLAHASQPKKILLMGDSWASFMILNDSFARAFDKNKICFRKESENRSTQNQEAPITVQKCANPVYEIYDNKGLSVRKTAIWGLRASQWFNHAVSKSAADILKNYKPDIVVMSIGGNDFLSQYKGGQSEERTIELSEKIREEVLGMIDSVRQVLPESKIILSGYDFARFHSGDIQDSYQKRYEEMGKPTAEEMSKTFLKFSKILSEVHAPEKGIFFIQHFGVLHYHYGSEEDPNSENKAHKPFQSLPIEEISTEANPNQFGGFPSAWQKPEAMMSLLGMKDAFHASGEGFMHIADHIVKIYLANWSK